MQSYNSNTPSTCIKTGWMRLSQGDREVLSVQYMVKLVPASCCPITNEAMTDPLLSPSAQSFPYEEVDRLDPR